jgi:hypothetical protein
VTSSRCPCRWVFIAALLSAAVVGAQPSAETRYRDPKGRFAFDYPAGFGRAGAGTNDGFGNRVAAVRFPGFAPGSLGGELTVLSGPVMLDIQALGGLYDPLTLEIFPDDRRRQVVAALPAVTQQNLCALLAQEDHLGASTLPAPLLDVAHRVDRMRNMAPRVVTCETRGRTMLFHKEATYEAPGISVRQHIFGAIRFLDGPWTSVQLIRGLREAPSRADLDALARIVDSFHAL